MIDGDIIDRWEFCRIVARLLNQEFSSPAYLIHDGTFAWLTTGGSSSAMPNIIVQLTRVPDVVEVAPGKWDRTEPYIATVCHALLEPELYAADAWMLFQAFESKWPDVKGCPPSRPEALPRIYVPENCKIADPALDYEKWRKDRDHDRSVLPDGPALEIYLVQGVNCHTTGEGVFREAP
jgi:hypothetical protein